MNTNECSVNYAAQRGADDAGDFSSAMSWPAIIGGAVTAVSISIILLFIGAGLGLSSVSPWEYSSAKALTAGAACWLVVTQWLSAGLGGYLSGRLRNRTTRVHTDELYFRDTAHGFLAWAVGTIFVACFMTSAMGTAVQSSAQAVSGAAPAVTAAHDNAGFGLDYYVSGLYRPAPGYTAANDPESRKETAMLFTRGLDAKDGMSEDDKAYLSRTIAVRTGLSEVEARQRLETTIAEVKTAMDAARKAGIGIAFLTALSLLVGAFIAGASAACGGCHRDRL